MTTEQKNTESGVLANSKTDIDIENISQLKLYFLLGITITSWLAVCPTWYVFYKLSIVYPDLTNGMLPLLIGTYVPVFLAVAPISTLEKYRRLKKDGRNN